MEDVIDKIAALISEDCGIAIFNKGEKSEIIIKGMVNTSRLEHVLQKMFKMRSTKQIEAPKEEKFDDSEVSEYLCKLYEMRKQPNGDIMKVDNLISRCWRVKNQTEWDNLKQELLSQNVN